MMMLLLFFEEAPSPEYEEAENGGDEDEENDDDNADNCAGAAFRRLAAISFHGQTELLFDASIAELRFASVDSSIGGHNLLH